MSGRFQRVARAIPFTLSLIATIGCGSVRNGEPLDHAERAELVSIQSLLAKRNVTLALMDDEVVDLVRKKADDLGLTGVSVGACSPSSERADFAITLHVEEVISKSPGIFGKVGLILDFITLGLIPAYGTYASEFRVVLGGPSGEEHTARVTRQTTAVWGWFGLPLGSLRNWSVFFGGPPDHSEKEDRVGLEIMRALAQAIPAEEAAGLR